MQCGAFWGWPDEKTGLTVGAGGPRLVERFGDAAVVLVFYAGALENRWRDLRDKGCSWDFESYFPHVTITYDAGDIDLAKVAPFKGELRFGPEIFEPLEEDWIAQVRETSFAAPIGPETGVTLDTTLAPDADDPDIDPLVDILLQKAGYAAAKTLTDPILGVIHMTGRPRSFTSIRPITAVSETMVMTREHRFFSAPNLNIWPTYWPPLKAPSFCRLTTIRTFAQSLPPFIWRRWRRPII